MRKKVFSKRMTACALAFALAFQPIAAIPGAPMAVVEAAENEDLGTDTCGATYDADTKKVTFFIKNTDAAYSTLIDAAALFYYECADYEEAMSLRIDTAGATFEGAKAIGPTTLTETEDGKEATVTVSEGTGAIIYAFNVTGGGRPDYEHIIVIDSEEQSSSSETSEDGSSEEGGEQEAVAISEFAYFDSETGANGKTQNYKTADSCFSFCYPKVNGSAIANGGYDAVKDGFDILVKRADSEWEDIETALTYEKEWQIDYWSWDGGGSYGLIIKLAESLDVRFQSTSNPDVYLDYNLVYKEPVVVNSIEFDYEDGQVDADGTGTVLLDWTKVIINDGEAAYAEDLVTWTAKYESGTSFVALDSLFTYGTNMFWDSGSGSGAWVLTGLKEPLTVRVSSVADPSIYGEVLVYVDTTVDEKGDEYDFSDGENNVKYDVADPGTVKEGYDLIWADEFNGNYGEKANVDVETGLNLDNWTPQDGDGTVYGNPGWGNAELQAYTGRKENVGVNEDINEDGVDDGVLRITAAYEETPYVYGEESAKDYTSARLHSTKMNEELFNTTYGYVEARISLPQTKGAWPAFWMLPQSGDIYGGWPVSGEIDIMETTGIRSDEACGTLHRGTPGQIYSGSGYVELGSDINYFHTYAIDWEPGKITWYYDGEKIHEETNWESAFSGASSSLAYDAPFDAPFYVLLNLAIDSGRFGGNANAATFQDDINMYVDYVRVYQKEDGYAESVVREATNSGDDWEDHAGINQIGTITSDSLVDSEGQLYAMETAGTVDASKWYLAYQDGGAGTVEPYVDADGKEWAKVGVTAAGTQDYSLQLIGHYNAKAGYVYKISFDAYAAGDMVGETVSLTSTEWKNWGKYGRKQFVLSDAPQSEVFYLEQTDSFDNCRIEFNLGSVATGDVYISNVKVEIVDPAELGTESSNRKPLSDGNVIYNGSFNEGNHRLGYWKAGDDTAVSVPRYTTEDLTGNDVSVVDVASTLNGFEPEAAENGGVKYYERRAQISADAGTTPSIYQAGIPLKDDSYTLKFEMYSEKDTTVVASIYTADAAGDLKTKVLSSNVVNYAKEDGVKEYSWTFTTPSTLQNAAVVLTFGDGASVQIDDVSMLGATQAEEIDTTPVDADSTWNANGGGSGSVAENGYSVADGVHTVTGATSGKEWYSPQITSSTFTVAAGTTYKISAKLKLENASDTIVSYMVQEQGGSWTVVKELEDIDLSTLTQDEDGFYLYETTFVCNKAVSNVALNWGLGKSGANNSTFTFKDVTMVVAESDDGGEGEGGSSMGNTDAEFVNITYVLGDGAVNADENPTFVTKEEGMLALAAPTREGYIFLGWTTEEESTDYITEISTNEDTTVYAQWEVRVDAAKPVITKQPVAVQCKQTETATLTVEATVADEGTMTYQWYVGDKASGKGATAIEGATATTYTPDTTTAGTKYYYCEVINTNESEAINGDNVVSTKSTVVAVVVSEKENSGDDDKSVAVTSITLDKTAIELEVGGTAKLTATVAPEEATDKTVTWTTSDEAIATVADGTVTAVKAGTATITAKAGDKTVTCTVTVKAKKDDTGNQGDDSNKPVAVTGITLDATTAELKIGETKKVVATVAPDNATDKTVTWASSDEKVATVTADGTVTAVAPGKATITATAGDKKATCEITVKYANLESIKVTPTSSKIAYGKKVQLKAVANTPNAKIASVEWSVDKSKYAKVSKSGKVTTKKAGKGKTVKVTAKVTDTNGNVVSKTVKVKIMKNKVTKVTINEGKSKLTVKYSKKSVKLKASVKTNGKDANKKLTWSSSNTKYATVDSKGKVKFKAAGKGKTVTITAKATDGTGKKDTIKITIKK